MKPVNDVVELMHEFLRRTVREKEDSEARTAQLRIINGVAKAALVARHRRSRKRKAVAA